jgi:hypothetical protein
MAAHDEGAVDRQPKGTSWRRPLVVAQRGADGVAQRLDALAGDRRHLHHRRALQVRAGEQDLDLLAHRLAPRRVDQIDLRHRHHAAPHPEQVQDVEVLLGLRHDPVVGGDHQQHQVDAVGPRQHVADEAFVAGHVDHARLAFAGIEVREPQVDRDAALALLLEPVGVGAGERLHQRRLAVVDVSGRAEDEMHGTRFCA